jgi:amidase
LPGDPYWPQRPGRSYLEAASRDPGRLRIAFSTAAPNGATIHPDCVETTLRMARLCEGLGHHVEEAMPQLDIRRVEQGFAHVFQANVMASIGRATGGRLPEEGAVEPLTMALARRGSEIPAPTYIADLQALHRESRMIARFHETFDLWLTPTLATPPPPVGAFDSDITDVELWLERLMGFIPFTYLANVTGQPAMSVPAGLSAQGLPIGCHFAARYGEEDLLFALAGQIERAAPWSGMTTSATETAGRARA